MDYLISGPGVAVTKDGNPGKGP